MDSRAHVDGKSRQRQNRGAERPLQTNNPGRRGGPRTTRSCTLLSMMLKSSRIAAPIDFDAPSEQVAQRLIGAIFTVDGVGGRIVETEAYDREDPAS
ncbi:MAG: putative 3-methyladenine glycosylase, partial [Caballeronia sp.]|nr:putative 3-methyladenine glycosylase [Caballeronia sp.]